MVDEEQHERARGDQVRFTEIGQGKKGAFGERQDHDDTEQEVEHPLRDYNDSPTWWFRQGALTRRDELVVTQSLVLQGSLTSLT